MTEFLGFSIAIVALLILSSCDLFGNAEVPFEGTVWKVESIEIKKGNKTLSISYPKTAMDYDGDGTIETMTQSIYWYFNKDSATAYKFLKYDYSDDRGSITGSLKNRIEYEVHTYTLSKDSISISIDNNPGTLEVSGKSVSMTVSTLDSWDIDRDNDTIEVLFDTIISLRAVTSPSYNDLLASIISTKEF
jgi:hypothetical protein